MDRLQDVPVSITGRYGTPWVYAIDDTYVVFAVRYVPFKRAQRVGEDSVEQGRIEW